MTEEIFLLMDERRKHKDDLGESTYKTIHRQIKTKIRAAEQVFRNRATTTRRPQTA